MYVLSKTRNSSILLHTLHSIKKKIHLFKIHKAYVVLTGLNFSLFLFFLWHNSPCGA